MNREDFSETLALINKYKAVEATFRKAEELPSIRVETTHAA